MWGTILLHQMMSSVLIMTTPPSIGSLTRCGLVVPSSERPKFAVSKHLCLQRANKPLPRLLFSARDNRDMSFHHWVNALHTSRDGGRAGGRARGIVWVMLSLQVYKKFLKGCKRSHAVGTPRGCSTSKRVSNQCGFVVRELWGAQLH